MCAPRGAVFLAENGNNLRSLQPKVIYLATRHVDQVDRLLGVLELAAVELLGLVLLLRLVELDSLPARRAHRALASVSEIPRVAIVCELLAVVATSPAAPHCDLQNPRSTEPKVTGSNPVGCIGASQGAPSCSPAD